MEEVRSVARSNDKFSDKLYDLLKDKDGNLVMSSFSVSAVLATVSIGAREDTLKQIREGMFFSTSTSVQQGYQQIIPAIKSTNDNFSWLTIQYLSKRTTLSSMLQSFQDLM